MVPPCRYGRVGVPGLTIDYGDRSAGHQGRRPLPCHFVANLRPGGRPFGL
jgi:hypothetical protein